MYSPSSPSSASLFAASLSTASANKIGSDTCTVGVTGLALSDTDGALCFPELLEIDPYLPYGVLARLEATDALALFGMDGKYDPLVGELCEV